MFDSLHPVIPPEALRGLNFPQKSLDWQLFQKQQQKTLKKTIKKPFKTYKTRPQLQIPPSPFLTPKCKTVPSACFGIAFVFSYSITPVVFCAVLFCCCPPFYCAIATEPVQCTAVLVRYSPIENSIFFYETRSF